jgi:tRNA-binding protein
MGQISWQDFEKVEMRVGQVVGVQEYPQARKPSYILALDFGPRIGRKQSVAALASTYSPEELLGRQVVAVVNFPVKQIGVRRSEVLVLAAVNQDGSLRLLQPDASVELGALIR